MQFGPFYRGAGRLLKFRKPFFSYGKELFVLTVTATLVGCASKTQKIQTPVTSFLEYRQANVIIQKWDLSCGAAALATILTYQHGDPVPEKTIAESMLRRTDPLKVKVKGGFSLLDLKRFVETRGFVGTGYLNLTVDDLAKLGPTIIPINLGDYNHFVVFRGIVGDKVLLADPAFGNRTTDVSTFQKSWLKNIGFIVKHRDGKLSVNRLTVQPSDLVRVPPETVRHALR